MDAELTSALRRELLQGVDPDHPDVRITAASIESDGPLLIVSVDFAQDDQRNHFTRSFDGVDLQMLTEDSPDKTAFAIATWVRLELAEYISELTAEGRWR